MKKVLLAASILATLGTSALAQQGPYKVELEKPQRVFVCTSPDPLMKVLDGFMQVPEKVEDRRGNYMIVQPGGVQACTYLKDEAGNVLIFKNLENFYLMGAQNLLLPGEQTNFGLYQAILPQGINYFILTMTGPIESNSKAVEPIGQMPDNP